MLHMIVGWATNMCVVTTTCSVKTVAFLYLDILNLVRA